MTKPGAIISHGYPIHYTQTELWRWQIVFPSKTFINLVVDTISFDSSLVGRFIICFATKKFHTVNDKIKQQTETTRGLCMESNTPISNVYLIKYHISDFNSVTKEQQL